MIRETEDEHAANFVAAFRRQYPHHAGRLIHVANEGGLRTGDGSHFAKLAKRKKMGVTPGVSDYFLAFAFDDLHGLWLELKAPGGRIKREQAAFLETMRAGGYAAACAWGWQDAMFLAGRYLRGNLSARVVYSTTAGQGTVPLSQLTLSGTLRRSKKAA